MSERDYQAEITEHFQAMLAEIFPAPTEPRPEGDKYGDAWREHSEWERRNSPYAAQTAVADLQVGDLIAYAEESSHTYRGSKSYDSVAGDTAFDFVQFAGDTYRPTHLGVVTKKSPKTVEVHAVYRPGNVYTIDSDLLEYDPNYAHTERFGESSHRVIIRLGQHADVVATMKASKHYPPLVKVLADMKRSHEAWQRKQEREAQAAREAKAPYKAVAKRANAALGFDLFTVNSWRSDGPRLAISDNKYGVAAGIDAHHEILRDVLAGRVALGKTEQDEADYVLDLLERFIERGEDGNWKSVASEISFDLVEA